MIMEPTRGDQADDLLDRQALQRVPGLSTELDDITEVEYRQVRLERVVLVGVWTQGSHEEAELSLVELSRLAHTAGSVVLDGVIQRRSKPDAGTYIGRGKARELADVVAAVGADTIICDGELTPGQLVQLEQIVKVKVVDRTWLILDIFAQHARSREGKAQVQLAQLEYLLPRLRGWGESLSRQAGGRVGAGGGGIGTRGPGETKLEMDRRRIRAQISRLRRQISAMSVARETQRADRQRNTVPAVVIAGYTNAGKSSLLNRLTDSGVLVQDALFATLDPTVRRTRTETGREYTLTDTVGFVRHLPHQLVDAFRSTLEEAASADLILHVVDGSEPLAWRQISAVREVLAEVGAAGVAELVVVNKVDVGHPDDVAAVLGAEPGSVAVSAHSGEGIGALRRRIADALPLPNVAISVVVPFSRGELVSRIHEHGIVETIAYTDQGTTVTAQVPSWLAAQVAEFTVE